MIKISITDERVLKKLEELRKNGSTKQKRTRSHALLLLNNGKNKNEVAEIINVTNKTVYNWINDWNERGVDSLSRKKGDGRKPILTTQKHKEIIQNNITTYPHQPKKAYALTLKEIDIAFSYSTFKRFLKKYSS